MCIVKWVIKIAHFEKNMFGYLSQLCSIWNAFSLLLFSKYKKVCICAFVSEEYDLMEEYDGRIAKRFFLKIEITPLKF